MAKEIIINHASHETRVAVMEDGVLSELHHEREKTLRVVDNIYKGKVLNVPVFQLLGGLYRDKTFFRNMKYLETSLRIMKNIRKLGS